MTTWHMLSVASGREAQAIERLRLIRAEAFAPREIVWRRRRAYDKRREPAMRVMMPGYVAAGFQCPWFEVPWALMSTWTDKRDRRMIYGGLGFGGRAQILTREVVDYLRALDCKTVEQALQIHARFRSGQAVEITTGPLSGATAVVESVSGKRAAILLDMLGSRRRIIINPDQLQAA